MPTGKTLLTTRELAERWGLSPRTLRNWRAADYGPRWVKLNGKLAHYPMNEVIRWERHRRVPRRRRDNRHES